MTHTYLYLDELERRLAYVKLSDFTGKYYVYSAFPEMADFAKEEELVFADTYTSEPVHVIRIPCDELLKLNTEEVEPAVGSYDFHDVPFAMNRFIIWRSYRSCLLVEERSTISSLPFGSLRFNFSPSFVIPGTHFAYVKNKLVLLIPTQIALYRFVFGFEIETHERNLSESVLKLSENRNFLYNYDCYEYTTSRSACRASIVHTASDETIALFSTTDGQLFLVQMRYAAGSGTEKVKLVKGREKVIRGEGLLHRVMKATHQLSLVVSLASCCVYDEIHFYVLFGDKRLHVYTDGKKEYDVNLFEMLVANSSCGDGQQVSAEMVKICSDENYYFVVIFFQIDKECMEGVVDFICGVKEGIMDIICLCKLPEGIQYSLRALTINCSKGVILIPWREVNEPHRSNPKVSVLQATPQESLSMQKSHIFDPNTYPFSVVLRSLQLVCKKGIFNWKLFEAKRDWKILRTAVENYCESEQFDEHYGTEDDCSLLLTQSLKETRREQFWMALTKMCKELLQNECLSLGLWHSVALGLYGTVQQGRFTVCRRSDEQLPSLELLSAIDQKNVKICWDTAVKFATKGLVASTMSVEEGWQFLDAFSSVSHIFESVIQKFTELRPVDDFDYTADFDLPFNGSFTKGLLATYFVHLVDDRLTLSQCLISLMEYVKVVYSSRNETQPVNVRWELVLNAYENSLHDMNRQFTILSEAMKLRVFLNDCNEMNLANAFFDSNALSVVFHYMQHKESLMEEDDTEEDEEFSEDVTEIPTIKCLASPLRRSMSSYTQFINKVVANSLVVLWPENSAMMLARFLADHEQFLALQAYCRLNEPYISELCTAFRFYEGRAFAGLGDPEKALQSFMDALEGVSREDEALNRVLAPDGNNPEEPFDELQFLLKVMRIMEHHDFYEQLVNLSRLALKKALELQDDYTRILPGLYTSVFKFELITERYENALNTLLSNPAPENRRMCLRELLAKLIEKKENALIINFCYGNMDQQVVDILKANARVSDVKNDGYFYELIFAYSVKQSSYRQAASMMLEYSCRLHSEVQSRDILFRRSRALNAVASLLSLLPDSEQFLALRDPVNNIENVAENNETIEEQDEDIELGRRHKNNIVIFNLSDISKEALLSSARLKLFDGDNNPQVKFVPPPSKPEQVVDELINREFFDRAWEISLVFDLKLSTVLQAVTKECIYLDASPSKGEPRWVARNQSFIKNTSGLRERHWAILRGYMEVAMRYAQDSEVLRTVTLVLLGHQWHTRYPAEYAYLLIMYDRLQSACEILEKKVILETRNITSKNSRTSIPVTEIDWLLWLIDKKDNDALKEDAVHLKNCVEQYFMRVESFSKS
ncbi:unnamed protein product [Thelazia callipaeda]|uniref:X-linked retinitis pigmentosa GTPase regulator-like protein n=1 Tax=Thelazia callipaeda TaxID=103827 RepID=A0A158RAL9_THECL|nr:unnamed protein product [Thelazia callipaeda]